MDTRFSGWVFSACALMLLSSCGQIDSFTEVDAFMRDQGIRTIVVIGKMTVRCPYGLNATSDIVKMLTQEQHGTYGLLEVDKEEPLLVSLEHADSHAKDDEFLISDLVNPTREGVRGTARMGGDFIQIYLPPRHPLINLYSLGALRDVTRHEMAHIAFYRAGLSGEMWLIEGFAEYVRTMEADDEWNLHPSDYPAVDLFSTLKYISEYSLRSILDWPAKLDDKKEDRIFYGLSHSLFAFLLERQGDIPMSKAVRNIGMLSRENILSQEKAWKNWVRGLDFIAYIRDAAESRDPDRKERASKMLTWFAEEGYVKVLKPEMDRIALGFLEHSESMYGASEFLVEYRYENLAEDVYASLERSEQAYPFLLGQALKVRRSERHDTAACEAAYHRLTKEEKTTFHLLKKYIFPEGAPEEKGDT